MTSYYVSVEGGIKPAKTFVGEPKNHKVGPPDLRNLCRDRGHVTPSSVRQPLERQRPEGIITNDCPRR